MQRLLSAALLLSLSACKGADGATGPAGAQGAQGPPGPQGLAGSANRQDFTGTISSSNGAAVSVAAAAFQGGKLPSLTCYISADRVTWLLVSHIPTGSTTTTPYCGVTSANTADPHVVFVNTPTGYFYYGILLW